MLWINLLGGAAVLGSYAHGLATHPEGGEALWGGVLPQLRPLYTAGMLLAALGYLAFTYFLLVHLDPAKARSRAQIRISAVHLALCRDPHPGCVVDAAHVGDDRAAIRSVVVGDSSHSRRDRPGGTGDGGRPGNGLAQGPALGTSNGAGRKYRLSPSHRRAGCTRLAGGPWMVGQPLRAGSRRFRGPADPVEENRPAAAPRPAHGRQAPEPVVVGAAREQPGAPPPRPVEWGMQTGESRSSSSWSLVR